MPGSSSRNRELIARNYLCGVDDIHFHLHGCGHETIVPFGTWELRQSFEMTPHRKKFFGDKYVELFVQILAGIIGCECLLIEDVVLE
jgi:hypothetical protein